MLRCGNRAANSCGADACNEAGDFHLVRGSDYDHAIHAPPPVGQHGLFLAARTATWDKTLYDPHVNLLRITTQAFSAVVGCAEAIDWHIFEQVCKQGVKLIGADGFISINVSGRHFRSPDLDHKLLALFQQYAVPTHCIRIEVTERALLENPSQVKQMLQNLRNHGVGIALDDFGTGYSSLSYLHQYPFETLKIDRSFITELPVDDEETQGLALVRAIQVLADSLKMKVIAEGIEEESQRLALMKVGCRYGQGYFFSKALTADLVLDAVPAARAPLTA